MFLDRGGLDPWHEFLRNERSGQFADVYVGMMPT